MINPQDEYDAKLAVTTTYLVKYYNATLRIIGGEAEGLITQEQAMEELGKQDEIFAKMIVDDISPKRTILSTT